MKIYLRWIALGVVVSFPLVAQVAAAEDADQATNTSDCATSAAATDCACCPSACCCQPEWKFVAGAEEQFVWSHVGNSDGVLVRNGNSVGDELGGYQPAGLGWLGVENCNGTGFRARYWDYNASSANVANPDFEIVSFGSSLRAYTVDLEATQRVDWDCWHILGSAGARYASLNEASIYTDNFVDFSVSPASDNTVAAGAESSFHGTGFTMGLEATRPLNDCGVNFVAGGRGSVLYGESSSFAVARTSTGNSSSTNSNANSADETHYIVEFQSGLEWSTYVACIHGNVFFRGVFEYQLWSGQDASTAVSSGPTIVAITPTQKVDFMGPALSTGVCW